LLQHILLWKVAEIPELAAYRQVVHLGQLKIPHKVFSNHQIFVIILYAPYAGITLQC
jgi:hypothetical protein